MKRPMVKRFLGVSLLGLLGAVILNALVYAVWFARRKKKGGDSPPFQY